MNEQASVKMQNATVIRRQIEQHRLKHVHNPEDRDGLILGSLLGNLTNNLRSALNYTMRLYVDTRLQPQLSVAEFRDVKKSSGHDFPWDEHKAGFDGKPVVQHTLRCYPAVYTVLERDQPFNGVDWLEQIMRISNTDKHVSINVVEAMNFTGLAAFAPDRKPVKIPRIFGDRLLIVRSDQEVELVPLPYYFEPLDMFATRSGWKQFFVKAAVGLKPIMPFAKHLISCTKRLIDELEAAASI